MSHEHLTHWLQTLPGRQLVIESCQGSMWFAKIRQAQNMPTLVALTHNTVADCLEQLSQHIKNYGMK
jgi:hypothetical protein